MRAAIHAEEVGGNYKTPYEMGKPEIRPQWQRNQQCSSCLPFITIFCRLSKEKFGGAKMERLFLESSSKADLDQEASRPIISNH